jgi:dienelactone hydrolase
MISPRGFEPCCLKSFNWTGTPSGHEAKLSKNPTYITGSNPDAAVLFVHDGLGWTFGNNRLLADHFAKEVRQQNLDLWSQRKPANTMSTQANVTVYMPDFFGGEVLDADLIKAGKWAELDVDGFQARNKHSIREPEIFDCVKKLRESGYKKIGAAGYCWGGWGVLRLATEKLVDCVVCAHPSMVTEADFDGVDVPIMFLQPQHDSMFSNELKLYAFKKLVLEKGSLPVEWVHFPGVSHGCLTKGSEDVPGEREAMVKAKDRAVTWWREWLS